jgi:hypothetical protein
MRTVLLTTAAVLLLAAAWIAYVAIRGPETTSGGGVASQYAQESN